MNETKWTVLFNIRIAEEEEEEIAAFLISL
jgi:hypothetical protein